MQPTSRESLEDVLEAAELISQHTAGRSLEDYEQDPWLRAGVERSFAVIGEAAGRLARKDPSTAERITDCQTIIGFRHVLVHGYDAIDHRRVWEIVEDYLPRLIDEASDLLREVDDSSPSR